MMRGRKLPETACPFDNNNNKKDMDYMADVYKGCLTLNYFFQHCAYRPICHGTMKFESKKKIVIE